MVFSMLHIFIDFSNGFETGPVQLLKTFVFFRCLFECMHLSGQMSGLVCIFIDLCLGNRSAAFGGGQNASVFNMCLCCMSKSPTGDIPPSRWFVLVFGFLQTFRRIAPECIKNIVAMAVTTVAMTLVGS